MFTSFEITCTRRHPRVHAYLGDLAPPVIIVLERSRPVLHVEAPQTLLEEFLERERALAESRALIRQVFGGVGSLPREPEPADPLLDPDYVFARFPKRSL